MSPTAAPAGFDLTGDVALVTGARRGLGLAMARGLGRAGAIVWVGARRPEDAEQAAGALAAEGLRTRAVAFDVRDREAQERALDRIHERDGRLDILVNNAATRLRAPLDAIDPGAFADLLANNLVAPFTLARAAGRRMAAKGYGRIVMVSSIGAVLGRAGDAAYQSAKGGVEALTRALACEFGPHGVTCNAMRPGKFTTEANAESLSQPAALAAIEARCPLRRHGDPDEIAGPCVFLASRAASYVNGHVLTVDGGYCIAM